MNLASFWCAPKARVTSGGGFRPESCRLIGCRDIIWPSNVDKPVPHSVYFMVGPAKPVPHYDASNVYSIIVTTQTIDLSPHK